MKFSDNTSCYYDNVILQFVSDDKGGQWKVQRYRHTAAYYRTKPEAYQAAVQLLFDARIEDEEIYRDKIEGGAFEKEIYTKKEASKLL